MLASGGHLILSETDRLPDGLTKKMVEAGLAVWERWREPEDEFKPCVGSMMIEIFQAMDAARR